LLLSQLLRAPIGSRLIRTDFDDDTLTLGIATTNPNASCPVCGHETWRVHSRYDRYLAEEPIFGRCVCLVMTVRRFFCSGLGCPRRIFTEPLDGFVAKHARTTIRLAQTQLAIGSALGGEAGARLAGKTAVPTSADTLLRRVKQAGAQSSATPKLVGIDDWAWCKGQRYGTIVVDLETNDVIALLPDRDAATVRTWLEAHPGIELVSRDRSSAYSQAASEAAPKAQQVADRWHLLTNVRQAIERLFERHLPVITAALNPADPDLTTTADASSRDEPEPATPTEPVRRESWAAPTPASARQQAALAKRQRRVGQFERVHELRRQGMPIRQIARELDMSRKSVRGYLRRQRCPDWRPGRATRSGMDEHREWIDARIAEGRINASELQGELTARGVRFSYGTVRRYLTKRLGRAGKMRPRVNAAKPKPAAPPSPRQLSFDWVRRPEKRTVEAQARLDKIRGTSPDLSAALDLSDEFTALIRKRSTGTLTEWLSRAEVSACPEVRHFAEGIRRDESAVNAAVTTRWSNGPVEGHVNRLKTIKRQMYGRARFSLLKARVVSRE
jgi:transposase